MASSFLTHIRDGHSIDDNSPYILVQRRPVPAWVPACLAPAWSLGVLEPVISRVSPWVAQARDVNHYAWAWCWAKRKLWLGGLCVLLLYVFWRWLMQPMGPDDAW